MLATAIAVLVVHGAAQGDFFRTQALEPIRSPDRVESLEVRALIEPSDHDVTPTVSNLPGRFAITPGGIPVDAALGAELSRMVLDPASYDPFYKRCIFQPGVAFRFWKKQQAVDLLVCFHCTDLAFQVVGASEAIGSKMSFGPVRARLLALAKQARRADKRLKDLE